MRKCLPRKVGLQSAVAWRRATVQGRLIGFCRLGRTGGAPGRLERNETPANTMVVALTTDEEAQLSQTIEMFEVITQSQPLDYQSLEILKEAYFKLGREREAVDTSKRIAEAYLSLGQLSSAILEYESILQRFPDDPDVLRALSEIELKASNLATPKPAFESEERTLPAALASARKTDKRSAPAPVDDGRQSMQKIFVEGRLISLEDFNLYWPELGPYDSPKQPVEPFIQVLADRQIVPLETSLRLVVEKSRLCYLPVERYEVDIDLARGFPRDTCQRWCILPFDRMSKSILIATANPFNKEAAHEVERLTNNRLLWYVASPPELVKALRRVFR